MSARDHRFRRRLENVVTHPDLSDKEALRGVQLIMQEWSGLSAEHREDDLVVVVAPARVRREVDPIFPVTRRGAKMPEGSLDTPDEVGEEGS